MLDDLLPYRGVFFFVSTYGALLIVAAAELFLERRPAEHGAARRWVSNLAVGFLGRAVLRLVFPLSTLSFALWSADRGMGALQAWNAPPVAAGILSVLALDLVSYVAHRIDHAVPWLWRLHRVHHADLDLDFSTTQRHHPFASLVPSALMLGAIAAIGATPEAVAVYLLTRGWVDAVAHGNLRVPRSLEGLLRRVFVTPDVHAVHHSAVQEETDSNYGALFTWWDRIFGTFREAPAAGVEAMTVGLEAFRSERDLDLDRLLLQPFRPAITATRALEP